MLLSRDITILFLFLQLSYNLVDMGFVRPSDLLEKNSLTSFVRILHRSPGRGQKTRFEGGWCVALIINAYFQNVGLLR